MLKTLLITVIASLVLISCTEEPEPSAPEAPKKVEWDKEKSTEVNRKIAAQEKFKIDRFLERRKWEMDTTGTGLYYHVKRGFPEDTLSPMAPPGCDALIEYEVSLLDGTVCYSSDSAGYEVFKVEQSTVESGLHEAIQMMRIGDTGTFILPSRLAHGLIGDMEMIPELSPVVYRITLVDLSCPGM